VHFLQIWIVPERTGVEPGYEQKNFPAQERSGKLRLLASPDARDGSLKINQDTKVYGALLGKGERASLDLQPGRRAWVQVARGAIELNGEKLGAGDGASLSGERKIALEGAAPAEVLVFDLP